jgi:hypothetical protein
MAILLSGRGRCFKPVDSASEQPAKFIAIDEQPNDQIMHPFSLGKTNRTAYQAFNPCPQPDMFALNFLCIIFTPEFGIRERMLQAHKSTSRNNLNFFN